MNDYLGREDILNLFQNEFEQDPNVYAMWQGGAIANNRLDEWSDIDLQFICDDDYQNTCLEKIKQLLDQNGKTDLSYRLPEPTWHGHSQVLYHLENSSPYHILDIVVMKESNLKRFLEVERHGKPFIHFDKKGLLKEEHIEEKEMKDKMIKRFKYIESTFPVFQIFIQKDLNRSFPIDAMGYYINMTVKPLIELAGMIERPYQYDFSFRYIHTDFSPEMSKQIEELIFIKNLDDFKSKHTQSKVLFNKLVKLIKKSIRFVD